MISMSSPLVPLMYGAGASKVIGDKAKSMGMTKVMVICDKGVKNSGVIDPILESLKGAGLGVVLFDGVLPDPPDTVVDAATEIASKEKVDGFIAVGGGSSIDTAKGVRYCCKHGGPVKSWFGKPCNDKTDPLIAVPTTAGTGSEMTYAAVITDTASGQKGGIGGMGCFASLALVDPELYVGMPLGGTVASAFDAYTHAFEAIVNPTPEPLSEAFAEKSLRLIHENLPTLVKDLKNVEARGALALAATFGGACLHFTVMCHHSHAIGHSLGAVFHLPHGSCCAVGFKDLIKLYADWLPDRVKLAAKAMGLILPAGISNKELGEKVSAHYFAFAKEVGLPNLKQMGVPKERLDEAIKMMPKDVASLKLATKPNPMLLSEDQYRSIVLNAYDE